MITVEDKEQIRRAYYIERKSIRQIHRETGCHRRTIRKALADGLVPQYSLKEPRNTPVLIPVKGMIDQWLKDDQKQPQKQRHTAKRIYDRLKAEYGFTGAESTIRRYVGQVRRELGNQVFIPLSYAPGETAQVDFGEAIAVIGNKQTKAQLFCMRLGYSKQPVVLALPNQSQESFFEGHVRAFTFLGGVPKQIVYDNLKAAVKKVLQGRSREEQSAFIAFRSHYLFESRFCTPGEAHEKGLVEGLVGYARRNWLVPVPEYDTYDQFNEYLLEKCKSEGARRLRGMETTISESFALEQSHLLPLPTGHFPCCTLHPVVANGFGLVTFQTNRYSVPAGNSHEAKWLRAFSDRVEITNGQQTLAVHSRCYRRDQDILNPLHYLPLLEQRPGAFAQAKPIIQWQEKWPEVYDHYLSALREHLPGYQATREFIRILRLHEDYPETVIARVMEESLACHCYNADGLKQLVLRLTEPVVPPALSDHEISPGLSVGPVSWPDVGEFDSLLHYRDMRDIHAVEGS
jgi:transposase